MDGLTIAQSGYIAEEPSSVPPGWGCRRRFLLPLVAVAVAAAADASRRSSTAAATADDLAAVDQPLPIDGQAGALPNPFVQAVQRVDAGINLDREGCVMPVGAPYCRRRRRRRRSSCCCCRHLAICTTAGTCRRRRGNGRCTKGRRRRGGGTSHRPHRYRPELVGAILVVVVHTVAADRGYLSRPHRGGFGRAVGDTGFVHHDSSVEGRVSMPRYHALPAEFLKPLFFFFVLDDEW